MTGNDFAYTHNLCVDLPEAGLFDLDVQLDIAMSVTLDDFEIETVSIVKPRLNWVASNPGRWASMAAGETSWSETVSCEGSALREALGKAIRAAVEDDTSIIDAIFESAEQSLFNTFN